jgi:alpha-L-arabinofuranosidase
VPTSPTYETKTFPEVPYLYAAVTDDETTGQTAVFALNRHLSEEMALDIELRGLGGDRQLVTALELYHPNLKATNTKDAPDTVSPAPLDGVEIDGERLRVRLKPGSWNLIVTQAADRR